LLSHARSVAGTHLEASLSAAVLARHLAPLRDDASEARAGRWSWRRRRVVLSL